LSKSAKAGMSGNGNKKGGGGGKKSTPAEKVKKTK
jgi:hypothetical protein